MKSVLLILLLAGHLAGAQQVDTIRFSNDGQPLTGWLYRASESRFKTQPVVVILHSATYGQHDYALYLDLARELNRVGIAVFSYDRRGTGLSAGSKKNADYQALARDGLAAIYAVKTLPGINSRRVGLYGISQGCWIAAIINSLDSTASQFNILVSGSTESPSQQMDFAARYHLAAKGVTPAAIDSAIQVRNIIDDFYRGKVPFARAAAARRGLDKRKWFADAFLFKVDSVSSGTWQRDMDFAPVPYFRKFTTPTLVLYGEYDEWVNAPRAMKDWPAWKLPQLTLNRIAGANHLMLLGRDESPAQPVFAGRYHGLIHSWLRQLPGSK